MRFEDCFRLLAERLKNDIVVTSAGNLGEKDSGGTGYTGITSPCNAPSAICVGSAASMFNSTGFLLTQEYCKRFTILDRRQKALDDYDASLKAASMALIELQDEATRRARQRPRLRARRLRLAERDHVHEGRAGAVVPCGHNGGGAMPWH